MDNKDFPRGPTANESGDIRPDFLSAALAAHDAGFNPKPILPNTKHPARNWNKSVKNLSRNKITKYWKQHSDHEVAILLDESILALDADTPKGVAALYQLEKDLGLTPKVIVSTARGEHHYYRRSEETHASTYAPDKTEHPERIDVKTGHTLLIIPPSTGKQYLVNEISTVLDLTEISQAQIDTINRHNGHDDSKRSSRSPTTVNPPSNLQNAINELASFLLHLDPDMGYTNWVTVLMVIFAHTDGAEAGLQLATDWSHKGSKFKDEQEVQDKWDSFDPDHDDPVTVGSLYTLVKEQLGEPRYLEIYSTLGPQWDLSGGDTTFSPVPAESENALLPFSLKGQSAQLKQEFANHELIFGKVAIRGQWTVFYARPNTGKTLIMLWLIIQAIKKKIVNPHHVFYVNADDGGSGIATKAAIADKHSFHMLAPGHNGFKTKQLQRLLSQLADKGQAANVILILDTLKKFTDLMNKSELRKFGSAIRQFSAKGGTVITLAHTNKNRDDDGKLVYSGTTDVIDDADCAYVIDILDDAGDLRTVEFENIKNRGDVTRQVAYQYSTAEGLKYKQLVKSVSEVDPENLDQLRSTIAIEASGDKLLIQLAKGFIAQGINTKTALVKELAKQDGVSKGRAAQLIGDYSGTDPIKHRWSFKPEKHNKHVYSILPVTSPDPAPAAEDPPEDS